MQPETNLPPQPDIPTPQNSSNKKPILIWALVGLLVIVVIVVVAVLWSSSLKSKSQQISQLQDQYSQLQKTNDELKAGIKDSTARIPELNLVYPLNETTQKIVYIVDTKDPEHPVMYLSTKPLMLAQLAASRLSPSPQRNICGPAEGAAGTITAFKTGETFNGKAVETISNSTTRKIDDTYWIYQPPPVACSINQTVQDEQKKAVEQAQVFFKSLEQVK